MLWIINTWRCYNLCHCKLTLHWGESVRVEDVYVGGKVKRRSHLELLGRCYFPFQKLLVFFPGPVELQGWIVVLHYLGMDTGWMHTSVQGWIRRRRSGLLSVNLVTADGTACHVWFWSFPVQGKVSLPCDSVDHLSTTYWTLDEV